MVETLTFWSATGFRSALNSHRTDQEIRVRPYSYPHTFHCLSEMVQNRPKPSSLPPKELPRDLAEDAVHRPSGECVPEVTVAWPPEDDHVSTSMFVGGASPINIAVRCIVFLVLGLWGEGFSQMQCCKLSIPLLQLGAAPIILQQVIFVKQEVVVRV